MAIQSFASNALLIDNRIYTWATMGLGDVGAPVGSTGSGDRTVQIEGVFGVGTSVQIEGTLDGQNWHTLRDPTGALLTFSASGLKTVLENVVQLRPHVSAGDGTEQIVVTMAVRRTSDA